MRWEDGGVHLTSLETREASVQECNGVKSVCNSTEREGQVFVFHLFWDPRQSSDITRRVVVRPTGTKKRKSMARQIREQTTEDASKGLPLLQGSDLGHRETLLTIEFSLTAQTVVTEKLT